jgi:hypothetical protein
MPKRPPIPHGQQPALRRRRISGKVLNPPRPTTLRKLRALSAKAQKGLQSNGAIAREIRESSDRSACIVMTSIVERTLEQCLLLRLRTIEDNKIRQLFERDGALSTFYGCIHLAFAVDLTAVRLKCE